MTDESDEQPERPEQPHERTTWAELFYDLVLVFALTQSAHLLDDHASWSYLGKMLLVLAPLWWGWVGTTLLVNAVEETHPQRLTLFACGLATFIMAVAGPHAVDDPRGEAVAFAGAYLCLRLLLAEGMRRKGAFAGLAAANPYTVAVATATLMLVAALALPPGARLTVWAAAMALELATPALLGRRLHGMAFGMTHLPERFGLFIIIALGESVVGVGARAADAHLTGTILTTLALAFVTVTCMWWLYFNFAASAIEHALRTHHTPALVVRDVLTYGHFVLVAGLLTAAVGLGTAVADPTETPQTPHGDALTAALLPGGVAVFVLTFCFTRWRMFGAASVPRLVAGLLLLLPLAWAAGHMPAVATLACTAGVLLALNAVEHWFVATGRPLILIPRRREGPSEPEVTPTR